MRRVRTGFAVLLAAGIASGQAVLAGGAAGHDPSMGHDSMQHEMMQSGQMQPGQMPHDMAPAGALPAEPGQGAFAAIAEIVAMLMADPATDWSRVDIDGLRQHLVDMDSLVTQARVSTAPVPDGAVFTIALKGPGGAAAGRMVPAHAPVLAAETGWTSRAERQGDRIVWTVTAPGAAEPIRALGFFGLMAVGDHHRRHHLAMARGDMAR